MEAHISSSKRMQSPQTNSTSLFYSGIFLQLLLTVYFYLTSFLSAWQPGQHRLVWKEKKQTWWLLVFLGVFSPCWHLLRDLALFYEEVFSYEQDPTCANSAAQRVSFISGSHSRKTNWGLFSWSGLSCKALPLLHNPEFLYLSSVPPQSCILSLSLVPILHSSAWKAGWAITRGLRAGWLPLIESFQQTVFRETAQSSQPARTCPDITGDHTVSWRSLVCIRPTGFWTIAPFLTHLSAPDPQQQVEKQTTVITWANMHGTPVTLEEAVPACWQEFVTHPGCTQIPQKHTHVHL